MILHKYREKAKTLRYSKAFAESAMAEFITSKHFTADTLVLTEFGCPPGPTTLDVMTRILDIVKEKGKKNRLMVYLVDSWSTDYNAVFRLAEEFQDKLANERGPDFGPCIISGTPARKIHEQIYSEKSLHFVHSSSVLNWLSEVPPGLNGEDGKTPLNKGKIYISNTSPRQVINAYTTQFRRDFLSFLRSRSKELVKGGRMVLSFAGRKQRGPFTPIGLCWELMAETLMDMTPCLVAKESVDTFNVPYYAPTYEELKELIEEEVSLLPVDYNEIFVEWDGDMECEGAGCGSHYSCQLPPTRGQRTARTHRASIESYLKRHFNFPDHTMDTFFVQYGRKLDERIFRKGNYKVFKFFISLIKI